MPVVKKVYALCAAAAGAVQDDAQFGSLLLEGDTQDHDAFVLLLDPGGEVLGARRFGDGQDQVGRGVTFDDAGHVIVHGEFRGSIDLDGESLTTAGDQDVFVIKLAP